MTRPQKNDRYDELVELLNTHSYNYHVLDAPTISDAVYDGLYAELKTFEASHPDRVRSDSPSQRVGNKLKSGFQKVQHSSRMLSLNDVFSREEVEAWVKRMDKLLPGTKHEFFADIKMDGLACALIYQDGLLVQGITRGDSFVGEDITQNVRTIRNIPLRLQDPATSPKSKIPNPKSFLNGRTEIRGEIVMLKSDFAMLNDRQRSEGKPEFANPRNLAAGTMRQLDPALVAARPLTFIAYDVLRNDPAEVPTNMFAYEALTALGIRRNMQAGVFDNLGDVMQFVDEWDSKRHDLPFNTDGLVVKINNRAQFAELGVVGKQPRAAVAYKYSAEQATTIVRDIVISIGRTGAATPVAVFDPVVVAGTTVQHASLHNADEIARLDVRRGDTVVIFKAGDIIPQVESVVIELRPKNARQINYEVELKRQYPELEFERPTGEVVYRVKGLTGPIILKRELQHFASKSALDIDTLGEKNVEALVDANLVRDLADIYTLNKDQLLTLDRFADISATKLIDAIAVKKTPPLERFLYGLGIRHVGVQTAADLVMHFARKSQMKKIGDAPSVRDQISKDGTDRDPLSGSEILHLLREATIGELESIEGIGEVVAESIAAWFADEDNLALLSKMKSLGVEPHYEVKSGKLVGKSFVVTGTLESMGRDEAADKIRALGGTFQTAVAKDTTYLVAGGKVGSSKLKKAESYGTKIIDEVEFLKLI